MSPCATVVRPVPPLVTESVPVVSLSAIARDEVAAFTQLVPSNCSWSPNVSLESETFARSPRLLAPTPSIHVPLTSKHPSESTMPLPNVDDALPD